MKTVKDAIDSLMAKGEITKDEYDFIEKTGAAKTTSLNAFLGALKKQLGSRDKPRKIIGQLGGVKPKSERIVESARKWVIPAAAVGATGLAGRELVYNPIKEGIEINRSFKAMKDKVPQLQEKDDDKIKDYFQVIKQYSPKAAANPLVAGALVNKMMEFGGVDHKLVQDIVSIESGLASTQPSIFGTATTTAAKTLSGI